MKKRFLSTLIVLCAALFTQDVFAHGVQLRWNIVPSTGAIRVWVEHWHGATTSVAGYPLVVTYTVGGVTTTQTYLATGYVNGTSVSGLPDGGNSSALLSSCYDANYYNNWVYWDFNPPACNTPVTLTVVEGTQVTTTEGCSNLYPQTITSSFNDNTGPAISCNDVYVSPVGTSCSALVNNYGITAVDACGGSVTTTYSIAEGSTFSTGSTPVTVTSTDQYGNTNTCTFNVNVVDGINPTVLTQSDTISLVNGSATVDVNAIDAGSYDDICGGIASLTASPATFYCGDEGWQTVTLTATDSSGNTGSATASVYVDSDFDVSVASVSNVSCFDACDGSVALNISGGTAPYSLSGLGGGIDEFNGTSIDNSTYTYNSSQFYQNGSQLVYNTVNYGNWNHYFRNTNTVARAAGETFEWSAYVNNTIQMTGWYGVNSATSTYQYQNLVHAIYVSNQYFYVYEDGMYRTNIYGGSGWFDFKVELKATGADYYYKAQGASSYTLLYSGNYSSESDLAAAATPYDNSYYADPVWDNWSTSSGGTGSDTTNLCAGAHTIVVTDANGCQRSVNVTITQPTAPLASTMSISGNNGCTDESISFTASSTGGTAPYTHSWNMGDGTVLTGASVSHSYSAAGSYIATLTTTDANGCSTTISSASMSMIVCNQAPEASCQNITVSTGANCDATITAAQVDNGSSDPDGDSLTYTLSNYGPFAIGTHTVTLTVTDPAGASDNCTATVTVEDDTAPVISCSNATLVLDASGNASTIQTTPASTVFSEDWTSVANGYYVNTTVSAWSVTSDIDLANYVSAIPGKEIDLAGYTNSSIQTTNSISLSPGTYTYSFQHISNTYTDNSVRVIIGGFVDQTFLSSFSVQTASAQFVVSAPTSVSIQMIQLGSSDPGGSFIGQIALVKEAVSSNITVGPMSDACGIDSVSVSQTEFDCSNVGANTVTLTVTDVNGNTSTCTSTVTVVDNTAPVVATQNVTVQLDAAGSGSITAAQIDNGSSDACGVASLSVSPSSFDCSNVGANTVTLTVTDVNGNVSTGTATVTVEDNVAPVVATQNVTVQLDASGNGSITAAQIDNGSSDACGVASLSVSPSSFDCSNVGANTVTLTVTDVNGNVSTGTATVTVEDNVAPVVATQNVTVQLDAAGSGSITAAQIDNGSSDACGVASLSVSPSSFDCSNVGAYTVTLTVTDVNGNVSTGTATVTVEDNVAPVAVAQNLTVTLANGSASVTPAQVDNGSSDACGIASLALNEDTWTCGDIGTHTVTLTVTDVNGNVSTTTADVTVVGQIPTVSVASTPSSSVYTGGDPNVIYLGYGAQSTTLTTTVSGGNSYSYAWTGSNLSSNTAANPVFTPTAAGVYTFDVTVTNDNGCTADTSIVICVRDIRVYKKNGQIQNGKVYLCHVPPGNNSNPQTLSISVNAVSSHLSNHSGDALGACNTSCGSGYASSNKTGEMYIEDFGGMEVEIILYPNPSKDQFTVTLESENTEDAMSVYVFDMAGNMVESAQGLEGYNQVEIGRGLASGVYLVQVVQGDFSKTVRAVKQ